MKHWKAKGSMILLAALLILIFFSKTIYTSRLPRVVGQMPKKGTLEKSYNTNGVTGFGEERWVYLPVTGKVEKLHIGLGDSVSTDDLLATMDYDREETDKQLSKSGVSVQEINNSIQGTKLDIKQLKREISHLENPETGEEKSDYQYQLDLIYLDIRSASAYLKEQRKLHQAGELEDSGLDKARLDLQKLYLQEENLKDKIIEEKEKKEKDFSQEEKDHKKLLLDKKDQLSKLQLQLDQYSLSLSSLGIDNQSYYNTLEEYTQNVEIKSPVSGTVTKLEAGLGETINGTQKLIGIGVAGSLELKVDIPLDNDFIKVGDRAKLTNANHTLEGQVKHIEVTPEGKKATISFTEEKVTHGETFNVEFKKYSETSYNLVPSSALGKDKDGYFINYIRQRDSIMGQEYYLAQIRVEIGDRDATNTAILRGIDFYEPVAKESDRVIKSGDSVFLENEKEFFDDKK